MERQGQGSVTVAPPISPAMTRWKIKSLYELFLLAMGTVYVVSGSV
jgi:hypothetical protein